MKTENKFPKKLLPDFLSLNHACLRLDVSPRSGSRCSRPARQTHRASAARSFSPPILDPARAYPRKNLRGRQLGFCRNNFGLLPLAHRPTRSKSHAVLFAALSNRHGFCLPTRLRTPVALGFFCGLVGPQKKPHASSGGFSGSRGPRLKALFSSRKSSRP